MEGKSRLRVRASERAELWERYATITSKGPPVMK